MTFTVKQLSIWAAIALLIALAGIWIGETPSGFGSSFFMLLMGVPIIIALIFLLNLVIKQKWFVHCFVCFAILAVLIAGYLVGSSVYHEAFNNCVTNGESVRLALRDYVEQHKTYPKTLAELKIELPGKLLLHPNILEYETTKTGYLLRFDDNFIAFEATESLPFEANK